MFRLFVLAVTLSACLADKEAQGSASPDPVVILGDHSGHRRMPDPVHHHRDESPLHYESLRLRDDRHHDHHRHHDDGRWSERRDDLHDHNDHDGPVILRSHRPHEANQRPDIARQNRIIANVYSPDYAEPTWVLDYRYLKSGGRDYTRGPGGQILILPRGIHSREHKEFRNYDELIEHLRLQNLAEARRPQYFMPLGQGAHHDEHEHRAPISHDRNDWWRRN